MVGSQHLFVIFAFAPLTQLSFNCILRIDCSYSPLSATRYTINGSFVSLICQLLSLVEKPRPFISYTLSSFLVFCCSSPPFNSGDFLLLRTTSQLGFLSIKVDIVCLRYLECSPYNIQEELSKSIISKKETFVGTIVIELSISDCKGISIQSCVSLVIVCCWCLANPFPLLFFFSVILFSLLSFVFCSESGIPKFS